MGEKPEGPRHVLQELADELGGSITRTAEAIDMNQLKSVTKRLAKAGRIDIFGAGVSGIIAELFSYRLLRAGLNAHAIRDIVLAREVANGPRPRAPRSRSRIRGDRQHGRVSAFGPRSRRLYRRRHLQRVSASPGTPMRCCPWPSSTSPPMAATSMPCRGRRRSFGGARRSGIHRRAVNGVNLHCVVTNVKQYSTSLPHDPGRPAWETRRPVWSVTPSSLRRNGGYRRQFGRQPWGQGMKPAGVEIRAAQAVRCHRGAPRSSSRPQGGRVRLACSAPPGCGKSTLLRILAGLRRPPSAGDVAIAGAEPPGGRPGSATSPWCSRASRSTRT